MRRHLLLSLCLLMTLTACGDGPGEFDRMITGIGGAGNGGGGSAPPPAQPAPAPAQPDLPGTAATKMLTDPEAEGGQDSDYVWASSPEQAQHMCERMAGARGNRLDSVRPASNWTNNAGMKRYVCYMTVFGR